MKTGTENSCKVFVTGKMLQKVFPAFPEEARLSRLSGKVEVIVEIDQTGSVTKIDRVDGPDVFRVSASEAAAKTKFEPPTCDGRPSAAIGIITYNFTPAPLFDRYINAASIEDFPDINAESPYYEALISVTENYKIAFGYSDKKYHPELPMIKGDFAHFLYSVMSLLETRAKLANKDVKEIELYRDYNPYKLEYVDFEPGMAYSDSYKLLIEKYRIVLADKDGSFEGRTAMTQNEVIRIWSAVFGEEAIPVNFKVDEKNVSPISRGEFAVFLQETMGYLSYKVLP
jgi:TonB family protein